MASHCSRWIVLCRDGVWFHASCNKASSRASCFTFGKVALDVDAHAVVRSALSYSTWSFSEWKSQVSACSSCPLALLNGWQFKVSISITLCDASFGFLLMNYLFTPRCDWSLTVRTDKVHTEDDEGMG
ncbi:uncharacterized protein [Triticum aestivum]|uniref:uncharacterized protein n=1 Tax=Triticum aestivum TaxID=4565 RepID=UPI001D00F7E7|nr:uncharacterized protein LOC123070994 [Triticum aestivum]XP_044350372.1 uncharacterized protein LOC123070994 [Triticum aestivum]XP_044350373.1 uncharacterized protein LOC123070994 [Triticum aestivum]XP_044350374.1 uncharacterized protein LOC123070994 [Triticum aestivum]